MLLDEQLVAYFRRGLIQPHTSVFQLTYGLAREGGESNLDEAIQAEFSPELVSQLLGKSSHDRVNDVPIEWDESEEPHSVSVGFFLYAIEKNWETGIVTGEIYSTTLKDEDLMFLDKDEHLTSDFENADFDYILSDLCFDFSAIEMLLPTHPLSENETPIRAGNERRGPIGRPPKWDWDAALESLIARAQTPDGLPSGPGAQAEIERMIADWFMETENGCPSESQIRSRAQRVMRAIASGRQPF